MIPLRLARELTYQLDHKPTSTSGWRVLARVPERAEEV